MARLPVVALSSVLLVSACTGGGTAAEPSAASNPAPPVNATPPPPAGGATPGPVPASSATPAPPPTGANPAPPPASGATPAPPPPTGTTPGPPPSTGCPASARLENHPGEGLPVRQGRGAGATLYAMFFPDGGRVTVAGLNKIVWRMTGAGAFAIRAVGPGGRDVAPVWLEAHGGSSFHRPGQEWGTGWRFPVAGCWTFRATRTTGSGELTVRVAG